MSKLGLDFDNTPDEIEPLSSGAYEAVIKEVVVELSKKGDSENLVVTCGITTEGPMVGRSAKMWINMKDYGNPKSFGRIGVKRLCKQAGLEPDGVGEVDTQDLIGRTIAILVSERSYTDKDTGEVRTVSDVKVPKVKA